MTSASNRRITELADKRRSRVLTKLRIRARRSVRTYSRTFSSASARYLEKIAAITKLDAVRSDSLCCDDGTTIDTIVHGATVGSLAVIALSGFILIYGMAGTALGLRGDGTAALSTTESAVPTWDAGSVAAAKPAGGPEELGGGQAAVTPTAWSPSTETSSLRPEQVDAAATEQSVQPSSEEEKSTSLKLYDQHASHYASGEYTKLWNAIDPSCVFIDEKGKRLTVKELRPMSRKFFAAIRNARVRYKIHNVVISNDTLVAHVESELRFDLRSDLLFIEGWAPHIKTEVTLDTWKRKANGWRIVETRTLRPETLRKASSPSPTKRTPIDKTVAYPINACGRTCAETMAHCDVGPVEQTPVKRNCVMEYSACMAGCRS